MRSAAIRDVNFSLGEDDDAAVAVAVATKLKAGATRGLIRHERARGHS